LINRVVVRDGERIYTAISAPNDHTTPPEMTSELDGCNVGVWNPEALAVRDADAGRNYDTRAMYYLTESYYLRREERGPKGK